MEIETIENKLHYEFQNKDLLKTALTHSSYCREHGIPHGRCNERLEFLGDAYLDAVVSAYLYSHMPQVAEGNLTKLRAQVVCEQSLAELGNRLGIGALLFMGNGESRNGGRHRSSIIADAVEAVIGAIYLDGGYEAVQGFVLREFSDTIRKAKEGKLFSDYKTQVQEILQKDGTAPVIRYVLDRTEGPDHDKVFYVHLCCNDRILGKGSGHSKKEAEQNAARNTLDGGLI